MVKRSRVGLRFYPASACWTVYAERALTSAYSALCKYPKDTVASTLTHGAQGWSRSGWDSLILHLVNGWHWAYYLSSWVLVHRWRWLYPFWSWQLKWDGVPDTQWALSKWLVSFPFSGPLYPSEVPCLLPSDYLGLLPFKILLKFHFLKPSLPSEHSRRQYR